MTPTQETLDFLMFFVPGLFLLMLLYHFFIGRKKGK